MKKSDIKNLKKQRDSNIVWLEDKWIYDEVTPFFHMANKSAGWNFQIDYFESMQFTKYKPGQFYDWHQDGTHIPHKGPNKNYFGKIRKLSVTVSLSDPKDYKGGDLQFDLSNPKQKNKRPIETITQIKPQGSIVVFPSHTWHRVTPVTKGTRYSLVIWSLGKPWR